uniref:Uncharacterized protein n=1 Tax=Rhizophora mucronata TaxID=61149 RepID=A0A2P2QEJ8_RHIMU
MSLSEHCRDHLGTPCSIGFLPFPSLSGKSFLLDPFGVVYRLKLYNNMGGWHAASLTMAWFFPYLG